jgi:HEAT repeat protein
LFSPLAGHSQKYPRKAIFAGSKLSKYTSELGKGHRRKREISLFPHDFPINQTPFSVALQRRSPMPSCSPSRLLSLPCTGLLFASFSLGMFAAGCSSQTEEPSGPTAKTENATTEPSEAEESESTAQPVHAEPDAEAEPTGGEASTAAEAVSSDEPLEKKLSETASAADLIAMIDQAAEKRGGGKEALQQIVDATGSDRADIRWHAARAIGLIGEDAIGEIPVLIKLLSDDDPVVAAQAASAIGMIREDDGRSSEQLDDAAREYYDTATKALVGKIVHPDARVRRVSIRAISRLSPPAEMIVPLVAKQLADEDPSVVMPALHTMADAGPAAVPFLINSLAEPKARYWASVVLAEIGPEASDAVPALLEVAEAADGEPEERMQAILALAAIGQAASSAGGPLATLAAGEKGPVQFAAVYACGMLRAAEASAALEAIAASDLPFLSSIAVWGLARIHADDAGRITAAYEKLTDGMQNENPAVRQASATGLSDLEDSLTENQRAELAIGLTASIQDAVPAVREAAAAALVRLGGDAVPALVALLGKDSDQQRLGLELLAAIGPPASAGFDSVLSVFSGSDDAVVQADAAFALGALAGGADGGIDAAAAEKAVGPLVETLRNAATADEVRYTTVYALGKFGPLASAAADDLHTLAASDDVLLATVTAWAGLQIEPENKQLYEQAIPLLEKALRSERELARLEAAVTLGEIGADASGSLPLLELVAEDDPARSVRSAAAAAVAKISSDR